MAGLIEFDVKGAKASVEDYSKAQVTRFRRSLAATGVALGRDLKARGDAQITKAGKFGARWTQALQVTVRRHEQSLNVIMGFHGIPYAMIHETGGVIRGNPLLWVPLSSAGVTTRIGEYPGRLFFKMSRRGNLIAFDRVERRPKFVGVESVTLKPRFGLRRMAVNVARVRTASLFAQGLGRD